MPAQRILILHGCAQLPSKNLFRQYRPEPEVATITAARARLNSDQVGPGTAFSFERPNYLDVDARGCGKPSSATCRRCGPLRHSTPQEFPDQLQWKWRLSLQSPGTRSLDFLEVSRLPSTVEC